MGAELLGIQPDAGDPSGDEPRILARPQASTDSATAREQKSARLLARIAQVVIGRLTGLLRQLELDRPSCLALSDRCAVDRVTVGCNVIDLEAHDIAATQLAIDSQIKHCQVARPALYLQLGPD